MTAEVHRAPHFTVASGTSLTARGRVADAGVDVAEPLVGHPPATTPNGDRRPVLSVAPPARTSSPTAPARPSRSSHLHARLFATDLLAVALSWVVLGYVLVHAPSVVGRAAPGIAGAAATLVAMRATGLYRSRICVRPSDELWRLFLSSLWGAAAFVLVQWRTASPGSEVLVCFGVCVVSATVLRRQYAAWLRSQRARGRHLRGVVLVGSNDDAAALRTMLRSEPELGYVVTGVVGDDRSGPAWRDLPASPFVHDIPQLATATGASGILIVPYALSSATTQRAIAVAAASNLHIQVWPGFRGVGSRRLRPVPISGEAFYYVEPKLSSRWQLAAKRVMDVIGAAMLLALTFPLLAVAGLLVKLEDGGPVLYRDDRVGLHGKVFRICKLRSMTCADEPSAATLAAMNERTDGPLFKASKDPRVTRVGRYIRASSIDELPQLWNVLRGTMSLVGPRPALPQEVSQFDEDFQRRHSVRPGMTGLWQVEARHNPSFNAYRRLDLCYVDNWSLYLDISIVAATVPSVVSQAFRAFLRSRRS